MTEIFAHRGLHKVEIENTVGAFLEAKAAGADGVELDVRRTRDGALVIYHDASIAGVGNINEVACQDLPGGVATLAEAMIACDGIFVNVEIKNSPDDPGFDPSGSLAHQVVAALDDGGWNDSVIISSFDLATCEAVRALSAQIEIGWLLDWRRDSEPSIEIARERGLSAIHPFFARVNEALLLRAHEAGLAVNVWTVNEAEDIRRMCAWGADTVITDDPVLALATRSATDFRP